MDREQPAKPRVWIVTPCTRPHNLGRIANSLSPLYDGFDVRWLVVHGFGLGGWGGRERNAALDAIPEHDPGWVYHLDDDTVLHPSFGPVLAAALRSPAAIQGVIVGQRRGDGSYLSPKVEAVAGEIDTGMFAFRRVAIGSARWGTDYTSDHAFFAAVREQIGAAAIVAFPAVACYHNSLQ